VSQPEHRWYARIHLLEGRLLSRWSSSKAKEAQNCFRSAIEIARKFNVKTTELQATTALARLLALRGSGDEARTMLSEIYNWFTEGFDTVDLQEAKTLLGELGQQPSAPASLNGPSPHRGPRQARTQ
jgi:predicted ATPase